MLELKETVTQDFWIPLFLKIDFINYIFSLSVKISLSQLMHAWIRHIFKEIVSQDFWIFILQNCELKLSIFQKFNHSKQGHFKELYCKISCWNSVDYIFNPTIPWNSECKIFFKIDFFSHLTLQCRENMESYI
jgi:hypothetical protein